MTTLTYILHAVATSSHIRSFVRRAYPSESLRGRLLGEAEKERGGVIARLESTGRRLRERLTARRSSPPGGGVNGLPVCSGSLRGSPVRPGRAGGQGLLDRGIPSDRFRFLALVGAISGPRVDTQISLCNLC